MNFNEQIHLAQQLLNQEINNLYKQQCNGCMIDHPSQTQHECFSINYNQVYRLCCDNLFRQSLIGFVEYHYFLSLIEGTSFKTLE